MLVGVPLVSILLGSSLSGTPWSFRVNLLPFLEMPPQTQMCAADLGSSLVSGINHVLCELTQTLDTLPPSTLWTSVATGWCSGLGADSNTATLSQ